ncbi:hypothetical protein ACQ4PT_066309 [Festuca glaucescens]
MGGPSASAASGRRCRWTQRSSRTRAAGDAVVRRTVSAPTPAPDESVSSAPTRRTAGFAHVDKQQRVGADSGSTSGSKLKEDNLYRGLCEFKHKRSSGTNSFTHQLARSAGRPECTKMGPLSAKRSLSGKMSQLRPPRHGHSNKNQNYIGAANQRCKVTRSGGAVNTLRKEEIHKQSDSSEGRHWQTLLDNALLRRSGSMDDFQVSFPSDTSDSSDSSKFSSLGRVANDQWRMSFKKVHCPLAARINAMSVVPCKEIEQPSPVSVLEPLSEDFSNAETIKQCRDHHDPQPRPELVNLPWVETVTDVLGLGEINNYLCSEMEDSENDETTELVEGILEEFGDEEERDFSYLLDLLISSCIHGVKEDELYKVCQSLDCPAGYDVFDKLEKKYIKVPQWSRSDRKLTFDMVNAILSEILAPCLDMHPWVNSTRNMAPVWGSEGLLEKLLLLLTQRCEALALNLPKPEKQAFNQTWPDLADYIDRAGREVEKMIKDDLLEELVLDLMSS